MEAIRHRVGVHAPVADVYDALATTDGVAGWWTRKVTGTSEPGGEIGFWFGGEQPAAVATVTELAPSRRVAWRIVDGPSEWLDTTVTFDLKEEDGQTIVVFTHDGWRQPAEFMHHCSTRWAYFLLSLRSGLGGGTATPWPDDEKIDNWN